MIISIIVGITGSLFILKLYIKLQVRFCRSKKDLLGKTVLVTGANTGIGFYTALGLAKRRARVIIACRNIEKGQEAQLAIIKLSGNQNVILKELDLSSLQSVRQFASIILKEEKRLDILINNAGISLGRVYKENKEGLELTWATNHFGPFLLTNLLLDFIKSSGSGRIIMVSSIVHKWTSSLPVLPVTRETCKAALLYCQTKLANVLFACELSRRLEGTGVAVYSLHPGSIRTELLRDLPAYVYYVMQLISLLFFKSPEEGAQTSLHCALSDDLVSGQYYDNCQLGKASPLATNDQLAKKLFEDSARITQLYQ